MAETFKLDTSGVVCAMPSGVWTWHDLDAFTQGYVEALLADATKAADWRVLRALAFRHLSPETLARIMEDCARATKPGLARDPNSARSGETFWKLRQGGTYVDLAGQHFPPLTPYLSDDGRVLLRERA